MVTSPAHPRAPLGVALACALAVACTAPRTEVRVRLVTDLDYGTAAYVRSIVIRIRSDGPSGALRGLRVLPVGREPDRVPMPASFGVIPLPDRDTGVVWIEAHACGDVRGCEGEGTAAPAVVTQRVVTSFVPERTSDIDMYLVDACRDVRCDDPNTTCDPLRLRCVSTRATSTPSDAGVPCGPGGCLAQRSCPDPGERGCGLVGVAGGRFEMGDPQALGAAPVQRAITVRPFELDAYEATVARFRRFWTAPDRDRVLDAPVRYPDGRSIAWEPAARDALAQGDQRMNPTPACTWSPTRRELEDRPINCVDWWTALAFCAWDGARLPTEAEWEYAARRGVRPHPWGAQAPDDDRVCWSGGSIRRGGTCPVGSHPAGRTPDGIHDLAGNVFEWLADWFQPYTDGRCWGDQPRRDPLCAQPADPQRVHRGWSWNEGGMAGFRSASRNPAPPAMRDDHSGFRCVRTR